MPARNFLERLRAELDQFAVDWTGRRTTVALSGGVDSTVLLAALRRLEPAADLAAIHVDHGLHPDSGAWTDRCRAVAASLGAAFEAVRIRVDPGSGESLEAAARRARYAALLGSVAAGDVLMTAHHGDDQLETVLLRMLRGSGVRGLAAIHASGVLEGVHVLRPLLAFSRAEVVAAAVEWRVDWIEDPANLDVSFDRNYLRMQVIPTLKRRWPGAHKTAFRLARHMREAERVLEDTASADAAAIDDLARPPCALLAALDPARQANLIRHLARALGLSVPPRAQVEQIKAALASTRRDAQWLIQWPGAEARIYRGRLYLLRPLPPVEGRADAAGRVTTERPWVGPQGRVELERTDAAGLPDAWASAGLDVRFRTGGERFRPLADAHRRTLKHWLQAQAVVPWMRDRVPLLYRGDALVAVADMCLSDAAVAAGPEPRWRPVWTDHPDVL